MGLLGFTELTGSSVVLQSNGVFKVSRLYHYNSQVFAAWGSGFIKLYKHEDGTSAPKVRWEKRSIDFGYPTPREPLFDKLGRMVI